MDQEQVNRLVDYAIEHGVNYFDTAPMYGRGLSERVTGIALKRHPREKFFIATKLSNMRDYSREASMAMYRKSFEELQVDYIDYYLLHSIGGGDGIPTVRKRFFDNGMMEFLLKEREAGRIRNLGFSYHGDVNIFDMLLRWHDEGKYHWDFVQIQLNYLDWNHAKVQKARNTNASYLYAELEKRGIPAIIMEPLLGGRLAKQPSHIMREMKRMDINATPAEWALRYAGTPEKILTVLSGMTYLEHLQENCRTFSPLRPINAEEDAMLMRLADAICDLKAIPCTGCNYCMPCPYGIDIPAVFGFYNNSIAEDLLPEGDSSDNEFRKARRRWLIGYDKKVERMRQADHCIGCRHCLSHCPQRINIPKEMRTINELVEQLKQA
jgi:predicted aldo/keto reductase-like oxidoreductase